MTDTAYLILIFVGLAGQIAGCIYQYRQRKRMEAHLRKIQDIREQIQRSTVVIEDRVVTGGRNGSVHPPTHQRPPR